MTSNLCHQCQANHPDNQTCLDDFHTLLYWEFDHQLFDVHHLMVICYYLQHPADLSQEWLSGAKQLLIDFVENGITPQAKRQQIAPIVDSSKRTFTIRASKLSTAHYQHPITWKTTIRDIVQSGTENYYDSVNQWAISILESLRTSYNL